MASALAAAAAATTAAVAVRPLLLPPLPPPPLAKPLMFGLGGASLSPLVSWVLASPIAAPTAEIRVVIAASVQLRPNAWLPNELLTS